MYKVEYTSSFKREYKLMVRRGYDEALIQNVIATIISKKPLATKHRPHKLSGNYKDCWECHILPDWLLIWQINETSNVLILIGTGTHADLF